MLKEFNGDLFLKLNKEILKMIYDLLYFIFKKLALKFD